MDQEKGEFQGRVIRAESGRFIVCGEGLTVPCVLRGRIKKERLDRSRNVVVGDEVRVRLTGPAGAPSCEGVIEELFPRRNLLSRHAAGRGTREQILMANLDALIIVMAVHEPDFLGLLLDRFLVAAEHRKLKVWICLNKCDLERSGEGERLAGPYSSAGYPILRMSALRGEGLDELKKVMAGLTSLLLGPSGTGKSTLMAALQPGLAPATREVSRAGGLGRHTTTRTELHRLDFGGFLADSPGVREFELWGLDQRELAGCFPEFRIYMDQCRFPDCSHSREPGCAVLEAVGQGRLDPGRHASYLRILEELKSRDLLF